MKTHFRKIGYYYHGWLVRVFHTDEGWRAEATKDGHAKLFTRHRGYKKYEAIASIESRIDNPRHHKTKHNPDVTMWVMGGVVALAAGATIYFLTRPAAASPPVLPPSPTPTPTPAPPPTPAGPQRYQLGTNNNGGSVTLRPGDTVSFTFPNDPAAASTANKDWFWTIVPLLNYVGRTTQMVGGQLQETDTFTYGGAVGLPSGSTNSQQVQAQFLSANNPALPTGGPNPPVAAPQSGASTFLFTIITVYT